MAPKIRSSPAVGVPTGTLLRVKGSSALPMKLDCAKLFDDMLNNSFWMVEDAAMAQNSLQKATSRHRVRTNVLHT